jgi:hypothetical protein
VAFFPGQLASALHRARCSGRARDGRSAVSVDLLHLAPRPAIAPLSETRGAHVAKYDGGPTRTTPVVRPEDRQALDQFFDPCSRLTIYRRFFAPVRRFPDT